MMATVPTTVTSAMTCTDSMVGKAQAEEATNSPTGDASSESQNVSKVI